MGLCGGVFMRGDFSFKLCNESDLSGEELGERDFYI